MKTKLKVTALIVSFCLIASLVFAGCGGKANPPAGETAAATTTTAKATEATTTKAAETTAKATEAEKTTTKAAETTTKAAETTAKATEAATTTAAAAGDSAGGAKGAYAAKYDPTKVITISWVTQGDRPVDPNSPVTKAIEEAMNIKIDYIYLQRSEQTQLLGIRLAAGDIPDVWRTNSTNYREYVNQGVIAEVPDDLLIDVAPTFYDLAKGLYSEFGNVFDIMKVNGKLYGIPNFEINSKYMLMPVWRDDWLRNVGINSIPTTVEEAEEAFYKFANDDPDGNGSDDTLAMSIGGMDLYMYGYGGTGMNNIVRDGKLTKVVLIPEFKMGLEKLVKFYADGLIDPEFHTGEAKGQYWANSIPFQNGLIGYTNGNMFYHINPPPDPVLVPDGIGGVNYEGFKTLQPDGSYAFGKALKGPYPDLISPRWGNIPGGNVSVYGINVDEEKMVRILQVLERQMNDWDFFLLLDSGIEGINYRVDVNSKGQTIYSSIMDPADQYQPGCRTEGFTYAHGAKTEFVIRQSIELYDFAEQYFTPEKMGCKPYTNPIFGSFDDDIRDIHTSVETHFNENRNLFITGQRPFSEFDNFISELKDRGIEKWIATAQEWYDATYN